MMALVAYAGMVAALSLLYLVIAIDGRKAAVSVTARALAAITLMALLTWLICHVTG